MIDEWRKAVVRVLVDDVEVPPRTLASSLSSVLHIVSAWNPNAIGVSQHENDRASTTLLEEIRSRSVRYFPAYGRGYSSQYEEHGWCVVGMERGEAQTLGRDFSQIAIYEASSEGLLIVWCDDETTEVSLEH